VVRILDDVQLGTFSVTPYLRVIEPTSDHHLIREVARAAIPRNVEQSANVAVSAEGVGGGSGGAAYPMRAKEHVERDDTPNRVQEAGASPVVDLALYFDESAFTPEIAAQAIVAFELLFGRALEIAVSQGSSRR
jgi:hypothetical protein